MTDYFDVNEGNDQLYERESGTPETFVRVNGHNYEVQAGSDFTETVKELANEAGMGKFRVFLDGQEITKPSQAPSTIEPRSSVEIRPYDIAG